MKEGSDTRDHAQPPDTVPFDPASNADALRSIGAAADATPSPTSPSARVLPSPPSDGSRPPGSAVAAGSDGGLLGSRRNRDALLPFATVHPLAGWYFGCGAVTCAAGAVLLALTPRPIEPGWRNAMVLVMLLTAMLGAWLAVRRPVQRLDRVVTAIGSWGAVLLIVLAAGLGDGVHAVTLAFLPLTVAGVTVMAGVRAGSVLAAVVGVAVIGLGAAESVGWLRGAASVTDSSLISRILAALLVVGSAFAVAWSISRTIWRVVNESAQREERFRVLLEMSADWYWEMDAEHRFTVAVERIHGASAMAPTDREGLRPWEIPGLGLTPRQLADHRADLEARRAFAGLLARRTGPDGSARYLSVSGQPRFDADGRYIGHWGVGRDVSAEVMAQQAVEISEARYRQLFARSPSAMLLHRDGRVIDANEAAAKLFGFESPKALVGVVIVDTLVPPAARTDASARLKQVERLAPGEEFPATELTLTNRNGQARIAEVTSTGVETPDGTASLTMLIDITDRLSAQVALRRSESLLSAVIASSPDAVALTELESGRCVMVSDFFCKCFGWSREEIIGHTSTELGIWADPADRLRLIDEVLAHGRSSERPVPLLGKGGRRLMLKVSGSAFEFDGRRHLLTHSRDISAEERNRVEREAILDNASVGIAFTRERRFELTNRRFEQMFGFAPGKMLGKPTSTVTADAATYAALEAAVLERLTAGKLFDQEVALVNRAGETVWCRVVARSIDPTFVEAGTIWIAEDVSGQRVAQATLAKALDDAQAASRAKSAFLANTSHELRTPLNGLLGLARLALQPGTSDERRQQYLNQIHDSAQSLAGIISDILDLSRIEAGKLVIEHRVFDLHAVADSVRQLNLPVAEGRGLVLSLEMAPDVPRHVVGDALRVRQILANFVANALKFTERGRVDIRLTARPGPLPGLVKPGAAGSSLLVRLVVVDTGVGIAAAHRARLFTPFTQADESTTRRFGGTGLGLSICRELAVAMRGNVGVDSEPGRGSTFWAELPMTVAAPRAAEALRQGGSDHPVPPGRRVLVVEDHPVNMLVATTLLQQWGLDVHEAGDGAQALDAVAAAVAAGQPFDLVIMDVQMPVMGGHEAARRLRNQYRADRLPIIALTAAAMVSERDAALESGMNDFVTKPVDPALLRAAVSRQLHGAWTMP